MTAKAETHSCTPVSNDTLKICISVHVSYHIQCTCTFTKSEASLTSTKLKGEEKVYGPTHLNFESATKSRSAASMCYNF